MLTIFSGVSQLCFSFSLPQVFACILCDQIFSYIARLTFCSLMILSVLNCFMFEIQYNDVLYAYKR